MEFCALCGKPCITDKHYKVVDVKNNKAVNEGIFCQACGLTYVQAVFHKPEPPSKSKSAKQPKLHIIKTPEDLLAVMLGVGIVKKAPEKPQKEEPCPTCGLSIEEFIKKGRFGCPKCYSHYQETFFSMADTFQNGANKHLGKQPTNFVDDSEKDRIRVLRLKMASAIEQEQYEKAAKIRDEINKKQALNEPALLPPETSSDQ